jgi:hypothetical protein
MTALASIVRRVRVRAAAAQPARAALRGWLAALEPSHYGLPTHAVLIVKGARSRLAALRGEAAGDPLAAPLRHAVRPAASGFVAAGAVAVWFEDEAELLACLARDALSGLLPLAWWWAALFGRRGGAALALRRWIESPQFVPAALEALERRGEARPWLASLGPRGRAQLLRALASTYTIAPALFGDLARAEAASAAVLPPAVPGPSAADAAGFAPEGGDATALLLLLCAVLRGAPHRAAAWRVARHPAPSHEDTHAPRDLPTARVSTPATGGPTVARPASAAAQTAPPHGPPRRLRAEPPGPRQAAATRADATPADPATRSDPTFMCDADRRRGEALVADSHSATLASTSTSPSETAEAPPHRSARRHNQRPTPDKPVAAPSFATAHGGLFFALNVALALGLYGDFTQPRHPGLPVSPWRLLLDLGCAWRGRRFKRDPLADWLAARAGPEPWPAAATPWRAHDEWLAPFADDARAAHTVQRPWGTEKRHAAGMVLALDAAAGQRALPLVDLLEPWLAARIALALGLPRRHALALMLALPARVGSGTARIDVHFDLDTLPLALRLAGLDRDPGWIPAAGTDIRFHFG